MTNLTDFRQAFLAASDADSAIKPPVRLAATVNVTPIGIGQTIDGAVTQLGDRVLLTAQTDARQNGIRIVSDGIWPVPADFSNLVSGTLFTATAGVANAGQYSLTTANPIILGTSALTFVTSVVGGLAAETAARIAADNTLQANINAEASTRATNDTALQANINSEAATRAAADTTLQTNITAEASVRAAADTAITTNLAASTGSTLVGFTQSGAGAVSRTVQSKERDIVSVKDFGAVGDGVTDDTAAIQATHDAAKNSTFPAVIFPAGTYNVTSLNWSPYVSPLSFGRVVFSTALASGNFISISDQFGGSGITAGGLTRSKGFVGQFYFQNTNAANTATLFFVGGATNANFATELEMNGISATGFKGGVIKYGFNAFDIHWSNCFFYNNQTAGHIQMAAGATNSGENYAYTHCVFGGQTGTNAGPLFDWNTTSVTGHTFTECSADYLSGMWKTGNATILTKVIWLGGHLEWNTTTAPYFNLDAGVDFTVLAPNVTGPVVVFNTPYIGSVAGTSSLTFLHAKYGTPPGIAKFFDCPSATGRMVLDELPNFQGASGPTTFATWAAGSSGGNLNPKRAPTSAWAVDYTQTGGQTITASGTLDLPTGSGYLRIADDTTGSIAQFRLNAGTTTKVDGSADMVAGAPGASQTGVSWTGSVYRITNGYGVSHTYYFALDRVRPSS